MRINVHAGHNPDGKTACGAIGLIKESTEARRVKNQLIKLLQDQGHTVYDCTISNGTSQTDVLQKIVSKCNAHRADLDISIHFNSGAGDRSGNGKTTGTECLIYGRGGNAEKYAVKIQNAIVQRCGMRDRGVKVRSELYVLRKTAAPAVLVECCFVDDRDDVRKYDASTMAAAIAEGITGKRISSTDGRYAVKITSKSLNIRSGPGTDNPVVGQVNKGDVYTIIKTESNWGKLKSGAGWISLNHVSKL